MVDILNFIDGKLVAAGSGNWLMNSNPATGQVFSRIADSDSGDVQLAVKSAQKAFPEWSKTPAEIRSAILLKVAQLIEKNLDKLARAETEDNGKPLKVSATVDIPRASSNFSFFAKAITQFASESHAMEDRGFNYTLRQPLGVVACISPWNLPLYLFTWKIAPALAAGNCVVAKPSEITPYTAFLLASICQEAGLPPGVLNIIQGTGPKVGQALVEHPGVKAISFTGGTQTGASIAMAAGPKFKKLSLELGGKNPTLILEDCSWEKTLSGAVRSGFSNQGQICLCGSRILIQESIYEKFRDAFVKKVEALKVGDPNDPKVHLGALVSEAHFNKVRSCIDRAIKEGGKILTGGSAVQLKGRCQNGWFMQPTVIEGLGPECSTNQEEIFGPVVTLQPFKTVEEGIKLANNSNYGLAASLWTQDLNKAHKIAARLEAGIVWINSWLVRDLRTPFGGIKNSGVGREGGWEALRFFTEPKNIYVDLQD